MWMVWINLNEGKAIGQIGIEHDLLTTNEEDPEDDGLGGNERTVFEVAFRWGLRKSDMQKLPGVKNEHRFPYIQCLAGG